MHDIPLNDTQRIFAEKNHNLAFAMGAARGTNNIFKSWCRMFSGQLLLLIMNAWCLKLFVNMVGEFLANPLSL